MPSCAANCFRGSRFPPDYLLLAGAAWMLYYDSRTVGSPWTMPYMVNHAEYHISKPFLGQTMNPIPAYRHESMRRFYIIHELPDYLDSRSLWGVRQIVERNAAIVYVFFFCPVGLLMLAGWLRLLRRPAQVVGRAFRRCRLASIACRAVASAWALRRAGHGRVHSGWAGWAAAFADDEIATAPASATATRAGDPQKSWTRACAGGGDAAGGRVCSRPRGRRSWTL